MRRWGMLLLLAAPAQAQTSTGDVRALLRRFDAEPKVGALQRAAARLAEVEPERVRSWLKRARAAAALPSLRVRVGRGFGDLVTTRGVDGIDRVTIADSNSLRFDVEATWALDRLVFDPAEIRLGRESQRVSARREQLLSQVAQLYYARRRLQVDVELDPGASREVALDRALAIDELTAVLDGLTGNALSKGGP